MPVSRYLFHVVKEIENGAFVFIFFIGQYVPRLIIQGRTYCEDILTLNPGRFFNVFRNSQSQAQFKIMKAHEVYTWFMHL